jgi:hypothetical protein
MGSIPREKHLMSTTNMWVYRTSLNDAVTNPSRIVGYEVEATDGGIGKIDKASTETTRQYLVVDTGFWIFGKKRLVPAGVVTNVDHDAHKVYVTMTKDEIKQAPDYDEAMRDTDEAGYDRYSNYYQRYGSW